MATKSNAKVVGLGGFEPPTSPLSGVRSNQLSYRPGGLMGLNPCQFDPLRPHPACLFNKKEHIPAN